MIYITSLDTELLTGSEAVERAVGATLGQAPLPRCTEVTLKVSGHGIVLTDNKRRSGAF